MLDIVALTGLEWLYDTVEDRYGTLAAWISLSRQVSLYSVSTKPAAAQTAIERLAP